MGTKRFVKPNPAEVAAYAASIGFKLDGDEFCDFYQAKGWRVGNTPMADWQAAVRTWKRRQSKDQAPAPVAKPDERQRFENLDRKYVAQYVERIRTLRTWRGNPECPFGNPAEAERRMLQTIRDNHGPGIVARVLAKCKEAKSC